MREPGQRRSPFLSGDKNQIAPCHRYQRYRESMVQVLGVVAIVFSVLLILGAITGRVTVKSCCAVADPRRDARMRAAFEDAAPGAPDVEPAAHGAATESPAIGLAGTET
jgi:hypothetical protein